MAPAKPRVLRLKTIYEPPEKGENGRLIEGLASLKHVDRVIHGPCKVLDLEGKPQLICLPVGNADALKKELAQVKYGRAGRSSGMVSRSRTFGYAPRLPVRAHEACRAAGFGQDYPEANKLLTQAARAIESIYKREIPEEYKLHSAETNERIHKAWRIGGGMFTSGIINKNSALHYHLDRGNFKERWSAMLTFKERVTEGGELVFPEWKIAHACNDSHLMLFHGQKWWHGVTPMKIRRGGYRITVVFYSLNAMWQCLAPDEELARARKKRTERERKLERTSARKKNRKEPE